MHVSGSFSSSRSLIVAEQEQLRVWECFFLLVRAMIMGYPDPPPNKVVVVLLLVILDSQFHRSSRARSRPSFDDGRPILADTVFQVFLL
jgi:hypothetical protein